MDDSAIRQIAEMGEPSIEEIHGHQYFVNHKAATLIEPPALETVQCFSLLQFVNLIVKAAAQVEQGNGIIVNVLRHNRVEAFFTKLGATRKYDTVAVADFSKIEQGFEDGRQEDQESFMISLMTGFIDTPAREELLKLASAVKNEATHTSDDDGYSQVANMKAGVTLTQEKKVKNLWKLKAMKTFPEIEQPEIQYILRLHKGRSEAPLFALYECDGKKWMVDATKMVRDYVVNQLKTALAEKAELVSVL